jgi:protein-S-isoprenylcysteine O-methyltransferase Ste14
MRDDQALRAALLAGTMIVFPIALYFRLKSQATREPLDRRQEGIFILATLRPAGLAFVAGLVAYLINPASMTWSSFALPIWLRWSGIGLLWLTAALLAWTMRSLGKNLTDTVVTRRLHTLVRHGPYRWVRHPFYDCVVLLALGSSLAAANWFLMASGGLVFALMIVRTRTEEEKLIARFGDGYRAYMAETGRFVPRRPRRIDSGDPLQVG